MSFKLSNTYLKLFIMTAAASAMLVGSECLHRLYFDIVPLGRPWEEFLYLLTFTSILCFSRWAFTKVCAAFFLFLCLIVNPVHFEVYQSWILETVESTLSQIRRRRARGTSGLWPSSP